MSSRQKEKQHRRQERIERLWTRGDDDAVRQVGADAADLPRLPPQRIGDLTRAARAAGCQVLHPRYEGAQYAEKVRLRQQPADPGCTDADTACTAQARRRRAGGRRGRGRGRGRHRQRNRGAH